MKIILFGLLLLAACTPQFTEVYNCQNITDSTNSYHDWKTVQEYGGMAEFEEQYNWRNARINTIEADTGVIECALRADHRGDVRWHCFTCTDWEKTK